MSRTGRRVTGTAPVSTRARARVAVGAALVGLLVAACGSSPATSSLADTAAVGSAADCLAPEVLDELGLTLDPSLAARSSHPAAPAPGRIPDDFAPTGAVVCEVGGQMRDGEGTWTAVTTTTREGSASRLAELIAAFDEPVTTPVPCEGAPRRAVVWLVDAMDRAVRPQLLLDGCGAPSPAVLDALDRLSATSQVDHPVELVAAAS